MKILYMSSASPFGLLVTLLGHSRWTHCVAVFDDDVAIDAQAGHGVRESTLGAHLAGIKWVYQWRIDEIKLPDEAGARRFAESQIGRGYDYAALLNFVVPFRARLNLGATSRWDCSEFVTAVVKAGGGCLLREATVYVTPDMAAMSPAQTEVQATKSRKWIEVLKSVL